MNRPKREKIREERIDMEIIVDAYDEEERAMGWYYYLVDNMTFPFKAKCTVEQRNSPLKENDLVEVIDMAVAEECLREIFVEVESPEDRLVVPLSQLEGIGVDDETQEAIEDWHYWVARGYGF